MAKQKPAEEPRNNLVWIILLIASVVINVFLGVTLVLLMSSQSSGGSGSARFESGVSSMQTVCNNPIERQKLYFGQDQYDAVGQKMTRALIDYECEWVSSDTSSVFSDGYNNYLKDHNLPPANNLSEHLLKK